MLINVIDDLAQVCTLWILFYSADESGRSCMQGSWGPLAFAP